ncbi:MAG: hypothetical protein HKN13_15280, partial [Rhodothermales bacterium]|nr:hypothetical protein [Rhodothermales bacterium]
MSIRGSFQNIRDQIGKINTILDGSKSDPSSDEQAPEQGGDRPPVSHRTEPAESGSTIEDLYQYRDDEHYQEPDGLSATVPSPDSNNDVREQDRNDPTVHQSNGYEEQDYSNLSEEDDGLFAMPKVDLAGDVHQSDEFIDNQHPNDLGQESPPFDETAVLDSDIPFEDAEFDNEILPDAIDYAQDYTGGSMIDEIAIDESDLADFPHADVQSVEPDAPAADTNTPSQMVGPDGKRISDRVVQRLLSKGLVSQRQVLDSWDEWVSLKEEGYSLSLWRVLTLHPDLKREIIFEEAALVYAFEKATTSRSDAIAFIEKVVPVFEGDRLDRMLDLFVIPVAKEKDPRTGDVKWMFVTHDPTRPEAHKLLRELGIKRFELRYWAESVIEDVITAGVLTKNVYLDRLNDDPMVYDLGANFEKDKEELVDEEELENEINRSSLINLFEAALV